MSSSISRKSGIGNNDFLYIFESLYRTIVGMTKRTVSINNLMDIQSNNRDNYKYFSMSDSLELCLTLCISLFCIKCKNGIKSLSNVGLLLFYDFCNCSLGSIDSENNRLNYMNNKNMDKVVVTVSDNVAKSHFVIHKFLLDLFFDTSHIKSLNSSAYNKIEIHPTNGVLSHHLSCLSHCREIEELDKTIKTPRTLSREKEGNIKNSKPADSENTDFFSLLGKISSEINNIRSALCMENDIPSKDKYIFHVQFSKFKSCVKKNLSLKHLLLNAETSIINRIERNDILGLTRTLWMMNSLRIGTGIYDWYALVAHNYINISEQKKELLENASSSIENKNRKILSEKKRNIDFINRITNNHRTLLLIYSSLIRLIDLDSSSRRPFSNSIFCSFFSNFVCEARDDVYCIKGFCRFFDSFSEKYKGLLKKTGIDVQKIICSPNQCIFSGNRNKIKLGFLSNLRKDIQIRSLCKNNRKVVNSKNPMTDSSTFISDSTTKKIVQKSIIETTMNCMKTNSCFNFCCNHNNGKKNILFLKSSSFFSAIISKITAQSEENISPLEINKLVDLLSKNFVPMDIIFDDVIKKVISDFDHKGYLDIEKIIDSRIKETSSLCTFSPNCRIEVDFETGQLYSKFENALFMRTENKYVITKVEEEISLCEKKKSKRDSVIPSAYSSFYVNFSKSHQLFKGPIILSRTKRSSEIYKYLDHKIYKFDIIDFYCRLNQPIGKSKAGEYVLVSGPYYEYDPKLGKYHKMLRYDSNVFKSMKKRINRIKTFKIFSYFNNNIIDKYGLDQIATHSVYEYLRSPLPIFCICNEKKCDCKIDNNASLFEKIISGSVYSKCSCFMSKKNSEEPGNGYGIFGEYPKFCPDGGYPYWTIQSNPVNSYMPISDNFQNSSVPYKIEWTYSDKRFICQSDTLSENLLFSSFNKKDSQVHDNSMVLNNEFIECLYIRNQQKPIYKIFSEDKKNKEPLNRRDMWIDDESLPGNKVKFSSSINDIENKIYLNNSKMQDISTIIILKSILGYDQYEGRNSYGDEDFFFYTDLDKRIRSSMYGEIITPKIPKFLGFDSVSFKTNLNYQEIVKDSVSNNSIVNLDLNVNSDIFDKKKDYALSLSMISELEDTKKREFISNLKKINEKRKNIGKDIIDLGFNRKTEEKRIIYDIENHLMPVVSEFVGEMNETLQNIISSQFPMEYIDQYACGNSLCVNYKMKMLDIIIKRVKMKYFWSFSANQYESNKKTIKFCEKSCKHLSSLSGTYTQVPPLSKVVKEMRKSAFNGHTFFENFLNSCRMKIIKKYSKDNFGILEEYEKKIDLFNKTNKKNFSNSSIPLEKNYSKCDVQLTKKPQIIDRYVSHLAYRMKDIYFIKVNGIYMNDVKFSKERKENKSGICNTRNIENIPLDMTNEEKNMLDRRFKFLGNELVNYPTIVGKNSCIHYIPAVSKSTSYIIPMSNPMAVMAHILKLPQQGFGISSKIISSYMFEKTFKSTVHRKPFTNYFICMMWLVNLHNAFEKYKKYSPHKNNNCSFSSKSDSCSSSSSSHFSERRECRNETRHPFYYDVSCNRRKKIKNYSVPLEFIFSCNEDFDSENKSNANFSKYDVVYDLDIFNSYELNGWLTHPSNLNKQKKFLESLRQALSKEISFVKKNIKETLDEKKEERKENESDSLSLHWLSEIYLPLVSNAVEESEKVICKAVDQDDWWDFLEWTHGTSYSRYYTKDLCEDVLYSISTILQNS